MHIVRCDSSHDLLWNRFVASSPRASFYHRAEWRGVNERCFGHRTCYLAAIESQQVIGVFPLIRLKSLLFGNIACSLPFVNYGGPAASGVAVEEALLAAAEAAANEWRVDYLEIRSRHQLPARYPSSAHKVSMTIDLEADSERLWAGFKTGQRQEIRRAYKNGFAAQFGGAELLDDFYAVLSESWRDLGTPIYSRDYLAGVLHAFPDSTRVCVIYASDRTPAAGALIGHHNDTVEGMWLGMRDRFRKQLVGYVLYWELVKDACQSGYRHFHLGRSTYDSGGEQFKKKWNAHSTPLHWHYVLRNRTAIPQLNVTNSKFRLAIAAWRRLPVPVTQQIGPMIARSIP